MVEISTSGYYAFKRRPKSNRQIANGQLLFEIRRIYLQNNRIYGSRRIWDQLRNKEQISCSLNRVASLMRKNSLYAVHKRKFKVTTHSKHNKPVWPNILNRNFNVEKPNSVWVTDITYIWTEEGWLYLAVILDLFSRSVIGLSMDKTIADSLTLSALRQAILRRNPPEGLICHSDRGSQYAGNNFKALLAQHGIIGSMSKKGDCWDNAVVESFFHTLKVEFASRLRFRTREEAKIRIFEYVEMYYNTKRAHSTLGYLSPFDYEKRSLQSLQPVY
jgi:transposase InsO family protein